MANGVHLLLSLQGHHVVPKGCFENDPLLTTYYSRIGPGRALGMGSIENFDASLHHITLLLLLLRPMQSYACTVCLHVFLYMCVCVCVCQFCAVDLCEGQNVVPK